MELLSYAVVFMVLAAFGFMISWNVDLYSKHKKAMYLFWIVIYSVLSVAILIKILVRMLGGY